MMMSEREIAFLFVVINVTSMFSIPGYVDLLSFIKINLLDLQSFLFPVYSPS